VLRDFWLAVEPSDLGGGELLELLALLAGIDDQACGNARAEKGRVLTEPAG